VANYINATHSTFLFYSIYPHSCMALSEAIKTWRGSFILHTRFVIEELHFGGLRASYIDKAFQ
jgi:hypothetical protein